MNNHFGTKGPNANFLTNHLKIVVSLDRIVVLLFGEATSRVEIESDPN
jgi:hypothetical protein